MFVLALSGWKGSGKDMVGDYLIGNHGFTRVSFADPLKEMVADEYNIPLSYMYDPAYKEIPLLQYPVVSSDSFIKGIHHLLVDEFRTTEGENFAKVGEDLFWTPRALAIFKGSGNRAVTNTYWTDRAISNIRKQGDTSRIVITDLRFQTEVDALKEAFGSNVTFARINRFDDVNSSDPSERNLDTFDFDHVIDNAESIASKDDVFDQATKILSDEALDIYG
jgi:hypothetical protein